MITWYFDVEKQQSRAIEESFALENQCCCSCQEIAAETEGVKLHLLIMQKQIDTKIRLTTCCEHKNTDGELEECKDNCERFPRIILNKDQETTGLKEKYVSLESLLISVEDEGNSITLALTLIMQRDSQHDQQNNFLVKYPVNTSKKDGGKKTNPKRDKIASTETHLQNGFHILEDFMEITKEENNQTDNGHD